MKSLRVKFFTTGPELSFAYTGSRVLNLFLAVLSALQRHRILLVKTCHTLMLQFRLLHPAFKVLLWSATPFSSCKKEIMVFFPSHLPTWGLFQAESPNSSVPNITGKSFQTCPIAAWNHYPLPVAGVVKKGFSFQQPTLTAQNASLPCCVCSTTGISVSCGSSSAQTHLHREGSWMSHPHQNCCHKPRAPFRQWECHLCSESKGSRSCPGAQTCQLTLQLSGSLQRLYGNL